MFTIRGFVVMVLLTVSFLTAIASLPYPPEPKVQGFWSSYGLEVENGQIKAVRDDRQFHETPALVAIEQALRR
ncbi:MAG: hypothetical protein AAB449_00980 [Patescibacteria group bacterium]